MPATIRSRHLAFCFFFPVLTVIGLAKAPTVQAQESATTDPAEAALTSSTALTDTEPEPAVQPEEPWQLACELGGTLSTGNSRTGALATACNSSRSWKKLTLSANGNVHWGRARFGGHGVDASRMPVPQGDWIISERNARLELRQDYIISADERSFIYSSEGISTNRLAGYHLRINLALGAGRVYLLTDIQKHVLELGVGYEHEQGIFEDENRAGLIATLWGETKMQEAGMLEYRFTYLPSFQSSSDWRIDGFTGLSFKISDRFSYKSGVNILHDNEPSFVIPLGPSGTEIANVPAVPARKTDIIWTNVLVLSIL